MAATPPAPRRLGDQSESSPPRPRPCPRPQTQGGSGAGPWAPGAHAVPPPPTGPPAQVRLRARGRASCGDRPFFVCRSTLSQETVLNTGHAGRHGELARILPESWDHLGGERLPHAPSTGPRARSLAKWGFPEAHAAAPLSCSVWSREAPREEPHRAPGHRRWAASCEPASTVLGSASTAGSWGAGLSSSSQGPGRGLRGHLPQPGPGRVHLLGLCPQERRARAVSSSTGGPGTWRGRFVGILSFVSSGEALPAVPVLLELRVSPLSVPAECPCQPGAPAAGASSEPITAAGEPAARQPPGTGPSKRSSFSRAASAGSTKG